MEKWRQPVQRSQEEVFVAEYIKVWIAPVLETFVTLIDGKEVCTDVYTPGHYELRVIGWREQE